MAAAGLLALLDDIATLLDDIAVLTKVAAAKTAGVVGDDLALNANQLLGIASKREIPVVLAVAKGSLINKAILVPAALALSAFLPWAITPLLMMGGTYLCFEGIEKILHRAQPRRPDKPSLASITDPAVYEKEKIRGAIRTDFILSAEIVIIALGASAAADFLTQLGVLAIVALVMTVGVYGFVALIVRMDDFGLYLETKPQPFYRWLGAHLITAAPLLLKALSVLGTAAMFLVGGGIVLHAVPPFAEALHDLLPHTNGAAEMILSLVLTGLAGVIIGVLAVMITTAMKTIFSARRKP